MKGRLILNHVRGSLMYNEAVTFNIARGEMKGIQQILTLAPSWDLINYAKSNNMEDKKIWNEYKKRYIKELNIKKKAVNTQIKLLRYMLDNGVDVQLVCFCTNGLICHRKIIAELYFKEYEIVGK